MNHISSHLLQKKLTCLHYAALHGYEDMARILLEAGIQTDALNYVSGTFVQVTPGAFLHLWTGKEALINHVKLSFCKNCAIKKV